MPIQTIGDMSQHFQSLRNTGGIKTRLNTLAQELASGRVADVTARLGGTTGPLESMNRDILLLEQFAQSATEAEQLLGYMQSSLEVVDSLRARLTEQTLPVSVNTSAPTVSDAAFAGRQAFTDMVATLNKSIGGRTLFGGTAVDRPALATADNMLADLVASIGPATATADIETAIDTWFNDPTGGFATSGYLGGTGPVMTRRIGANVDVTLDARADDPASRLVLQAAATAAIASEMGSAIDNDTRAQLVASSGQKLLASAGPLTHMRARIGLAEARTADTSVSLSAEKSAFEMLRNEIVAADPFEAATQLQDVQQQLEMHFTVTARLSRLSLVNYLR